MKNVLLAIFFLLVPASASAQEVTPALGLLVSTQGELAPLGRALMETAALAASDVGIHLVVREITEEPSSLVDALRSLHQDRRVVAVVGPIGDRSAALAATQADRLGIGLFAIASHDHLRARGGWASGIRYSQREQSRLMAKVAFERGHRNVGVLYPEDEAGRQSAQAFIERFTGLGGRITTAASYPDDTTNYRQTLQVLTHRALRVTPRLQVGPWRADARGYLRWPRPFPDLDALFIPDEGRRVARLLAFLPAAGIENGEGSYQEVEARSVELLGLTSWRSPELQLSGARASGAFFVETWAGPRAGVAEDDFMRFFEEHLAREPTSIEADVYDLIRFLGETAHRIDTPTREAMMQGLIDRGDWQGVTGRWRIHGRGHIERDWRLMRFDVDGVYYPAH